MRPIDDNRDDYRLALSLELYELREQHEWSLSQLAKQTKIPEATLRHYERGRQIPQLPKLVALAQAYKIPALNILISTAERIYRIYREPVPDSVRLSRDRTALLALALYCGVSLEDLRLSECSSPRAPDDIAGDLFD